MRKREQYMTQEQIIAHAKNLITIPTTSANLPALHEAIDYIAKLLQPYNDITVERFEQNNIPSLLAYYGKNRPEAFDVILNGHVDVVPAQDASQYMPAVKDGRLYGRGAYDMKLATVAMVDAFIQHGYNPTRPVGLQIVADEETGGRNGILHQLQQGVRANFTVIGEMTNLGICNETRGICWVEIGFKGTSAHGGYAWNGDNAIAKASDFATRLLQKFPVPKAQQWCTTANIAAISTGNSTYNIVPDDALVKVDFRFTPEDADFVNEASVRAMVKSVHPDAEVLEFVTFEPAVFVPLENDHLKHFMRTFQSVTGEKTPLIKRYAASDSRHMAAYGVAAIEFGISGADHHSQQEYAELASLQPFCDTLHAFLQSPLPHNTVPVHAGQIVATA
jgi:succinyl-diaminopimelate desuccinylase